MGGKISKNSPSSVARSQSSPADVPVERKSALYWVMTYTRPTEYQLESLMSMMPVVSAKSTAAWRDRGSAKQAFSLARLQAVLRVCLS